MGTLRAFIRLFFFLLLAASLALPAEGQRLLRGGCTPSIINEVVAPQTANARQIRQPNSLRLLPPKTSWDPDRIYRQLVILVEPSDMPFQDNHTRDFYDKILNTPGYNEGLGPGSVADYFREQSGGLFNPVFDVFGPYKVSQKAQPYETPTSKTRNYGSASMTEAGKQFFAEHPDLDYEQYDWNGDGTIDQTIFIFAGYCGNQGADSFGYLWPSTSTLSIKGSVDGQRMAWYSCSAELWLTDESCGIGTICHEYSHCFGLPDVYPTASSSDYYSVFDEWDLMDGGNFTNWGWCPPNYTAQEKMYLGWLNPIELKEPVTITGMKSVSDGGEAYIIKHTDSEYLLLENRQQTAWDAYTPGKGLLITHINFNATAWRDNLVNAQLDNFPYFRYDIVHADNLDYEQWDDLIAERNEDDWLDDYDHLYNRHLSTSPYPWQTDSTDFVNCMLTDTSVPAATTYTANAEGRKLLSKTITNIQMSPDGLISFDFMGGTTAVSAVRSVGDHTPEAYFDLSGHRFSSPPATPGIYIVRYTDGTTKKCIR